MKTKKIRDWICSAFAGLCLLMLVGCDTEIEVQVDRSYADATIQIDVIKIQRGDTRWIYKDPEDYFTPGDPLREKALDENRIYEMHYNVPGKRFQNRIGPDSPVWQQFGYNGRGEPEFDIFVMVDAPVAVSKANPQSRKRLVPLDRRSWDVSLWGKLLGGSKLELNVRITPDGVLLDPAPSSG